MPRRWTRRQFVKQSAVLSAATALGVHVPADVAAASDGALYTGVLLSVEGGDAATVLLTNGRTATVRVAPGAFVAQGIVGLTADLAPFEPGESVVFRAPSAEPPFVAQEFQSIFRPMRGIVISDDGERLRTSAGPLRVPATVRERLDIAQFRNGESYSSNVWINPNSGEAVAAVIRIG